MSEIVMADEKFEKCFPHARKLIWNILEHPHSSLAAKIYSYVSIFFVLLSTLIVIVGTLPYLKAPQPHTTAAPISRNSTVTQRLSILDHNPYSRIPGLGLVNLICVLFFTLEFVLRAFSSPGKLKFLMSPSNICDLASILPFYTYVIFLYALDSETSVKVLRSFSLLRMLRMLRILRLARHSSGLRILGKTIRKSARELGLLFMFISTFVLVFSSLTYCAESEEPETQFTSIPASFWYTQFQMQFT